MKKWMFLLFFGMMASQLEAQQIPLYSQYYYNPFMYNPARTGERDATQLYLMYRKQWVDFKGAPETRVATLDGTIKDKIGLGGYVFSDITNIVERIGAQLAYAYYFKIGEHHKLSLGLSAGVLETRVDFSKVVIDDLNDALLGTNQQRGLNFDASAGISYWFKGLQVGFSVPQVLGTNIRFQDRDESSYRMGRHYLSTVGYAIPLMDEQFFIEPNAMFRTTDKFNTYQVDFGSSFRYKDLGWVSVMYRYDYALSFGGGFRLHDRFTLGYSYDMALNSIKDYTGGTHELLMGIKFGKKEDKGIIEAVRNMQEKQQQQANQISELETKNENLQKSVEQRDAEISQLKKEITQSVKEFQDSLISAKQEIMQLQEDYLKGVKKSDIEYSKTDAKKETTAIESERKYLIVLSAFSDEANAKRKVVDLKKKNVDTGIFFNKQKNVHYIYLRNPGTLKEGLEKANQLKKEPEFKDTWIFYLED